MNGVSHEGGSIVDGYGATANHAYLGVFKGSAQVLYSGNLWNDIGTDQNNYRAGSLFENKVNRRSFAFTLLLHRKAYAGFFLCHFGHDRDGTVCASTGNNDHCVNTDI